MSNGYQRDYKSAIENSAVTEPFFYSMLIQKEA